MPRPLAFTGISHDTYKIHFASNDKRKIYKWLRVIQCYQSINIQLKAQNWTREISRSLSFVTYHSRFSLARNRDSLVDWVRRSQSRPWCSCSTLTFLLRQVAHHAANFRRFVDNSESCIYKCSVHCQSLSVPFFPCDPYRSWYYGLNQETTISSPNLSSSTPTLLQFLSVSC